MGPIPLFRRRRHEEENPGDPLTEDSADETWMRRGDPEAEEIRFAAIQSGKPEEVIGWLHFSVYREGSPTYADNATTNAAMLAINERLGFQKHRDSIMAQISLETLDQYLVRGGD